MQTLTIEINDIKTLKLLEDLEALNLLVIRKPLVEAKTKKMARKSNETSEEQLKTPVFTKKQIKAIEGMPNSI